MPFNKKRNTILSKVNKQKMNIKKKLMAISLKVDYYIYKNKKISAADATSYYHEVMSYQALCKHDERSLQVIEKLSRFMVAIIEEQTGHVNIGEPDILKAYTQDTDNDRVSPVYSMTEEDRYELNLSCRQYYRQTSFTESIDKTDLNEQNGSVNKICENQSATVVAVEVNNSSAAHNNTKEDSVEELVSFIDLTINESIDTSLGVRACSPSILNNTLRPETQNMQNLYADQCGQDIAEVDRVIHDLLKRDKSKSAQDDKEKKIYFKTIAGNPNLHISPPPETLNLLNVQNQLLDSKAKRQIEHGKTTKPAKQRKIENPIEHVRKVKHENDKTAHKNKNTATKKGRSKVSPNNNIVYENDLSWIENIKFVREVNRDEYEPTTLGEALWENCELPISWDNFV